MKALLCKRYGSPVTLALFKGGSTVGAFQGKLKSAITVHYQLERRPTPCATLLCDPSSARSCSLLSGTFTDGVSAERLHKTARSG